MKPRIEELLLQFGNTYGSMVVRVWAPVKPRGTVFCIHEFDGHGSDFDFLAKHLVGQNFTVVCPDMIGRGKSTFFGKTTMYGYEACLVCIGALSKFAGEKNYFIGTGWGGAIAMMFLGTTRVRAEKLVLNGVGLRGSAAVDAELDLIRADAAAEFDSVEVAYTYVRRRRGHVREFAEELWPDYLVHKIRFVEGKYRLAFDPAIIPDAREAQYDLFPLFEKISAEVLLLFEEKSEVYDATAVADLLRTRPGFSCISGIKAGHPPSLMTDEQTQMIAAYLAG